MNVSEWKDGKPELSAWQSDYIFKRFDDDLAIACCGISSGKSAALAIWIVLQCCKKPGIRGIIVAQTFRALEKVLIQEIRTFCDWSHIEYTFNRGKMEIHFANGSQLFAYSAENPNAVLGLSEIALLAIDEAAYASEEMYHFCRDRMRGSKYKSMTRLISSPNSTDKVQNWFSTLVKKYPDKVVHATALDNRFTSEEFKAELKERYQEGTNLYRQQVLGEIVDTDIASQIVMRHDFASTLQGTSTKYYLGYDASGLGADKDVIVVINEFGIVEQHEFLEASTFVKAECIANMYQKYNIISSCADATGGYALGVIDVLKAKDIDIQGVNFAQKANDADKYPNARTEMYMNLAKKIKSGFFISDNNIKDEILAQQVTINNRGQQALVPKDLIKKQLGHSPDHSDALALAMYAMTYSSTNPAYDAKKAADIADKYLAYFNYGT